MARILFAAELGCGLGHVGRLWPVAKHLGDQGHELVFAVPDADAAVGMLRCDPRRIRSAPAPDREPQSSLGFQAATYADILARNGYSDPNRLATLVRDWADLIDSVAPQLVVVDHGPTVCLAASGTVPVVVLGDGFTIPPLQSNELLGISAAKPSIEPQRVLQVIQTVQRQRARPVPDSLEEAFPSASRFLLTYRELDPYRAHQTPDYSGPLERQLPVEPANEVRRVFAYLDGRCGGVADVLAVFPGIGVHVSAFVRNLCGRIAGRLRSFGVELFDRPRVLAREFPGISAVVHHGGLNTATAALAAGLPQLILPRHMEQDLNARALVALGVGSTISGRHTRRSLGQHLGRFLRESDAVRRARDLAQVVARRSDEGSLRSVVERCHQLAN